MANFLVVGLGNPGKEYSQTRHNAGFIFVDEMVKNLSLEPFKIFQNGELSMSNYQGIKLFVAKPHTYMNLSGDYVSAIIKYYKISISNIVIVYDDIDLEPGKLRFREEGSPGTHNGMRDIVQKLGTNTIKRVRLGIGKNPNIKLADYVLERFSSQELLNLYQTFPEALTKIINLCKSVVI